jgi:hypothetical protein
MTDSHRQERGDNAEAVDHQRIALCYDVVFLTRLESSQVLTQLSESPLSVELFWTVLMNCHAFRGACRAFAMV